MYDTLKRLYGNQQLDETGLRRSVNLNWTNSQQFTEISEIVY
ncbi:hypothetical protein [Paenibacillus endoradicis]|nr:hypothetical protein [Paenibacillus endoradicis]MCR8658972.1 hypothetical protein [Paenibacillus endoradicis]